MRHFYGEDGYTQYSQNRDILVKMGELLFENVKTPEGRALQRAAVYEAAVEIISDFQIHDTMSGCGGCLTVEQWQNKEEADPLIGVLKELFFHFISSGFLYKEFMLAAWEAVCECQLYYVIGDTSTF